MAEIRTKPTGNRYIIIRNANIYDWWDHFFDYLDPNVNILDIQYFDKYSYLVERLLDKLVCCGWREEDRGRIQTLNNACLHRDQTTHQCLCADKLLSARVAKLECTDGVRKACAADGKHYVRKYEKPMVVGYVTIEKIGPLKDYRRKV